MGISSSMWVGASGLAAHGEAIETTGDNIANVNTVGFKGSRAVFEDVIGRSMRGALGQQTTQGMGVKIAGIDKNLSQGSLQNTGIVTDLAIDGGGYFVFAGTQRGVSGQFYGRNGQLNIAEDGSLVNMQGLKLQGHPVDATGQLLGSVGDIRVANQTVPPLATQNVTLDANLDSAASVPAAFDPLDPYATSNFSTSATVYDSLGTPRQVDLYFRNTGGNAWEWNAMIDGSQVAGGTPGTPVVGGSGTLSFNAQGQLDAVSGAATTWDFNGANPGQAVTFDFGDAISAGGTGLAGTTQFAAASSVENLSQDGYAAGTVQSISISDDGIISGAYSNGTRMALGQVVLATFPAEEGLERTGGTLFSATQQSGQALIGEPATGARGRVIGGALEQSNVDLGKEFVDLIALQRGFQASSKIVTTADEMLQETMQLKR